MHALQVTNSPQLSAERLNSIRPLTGKARTPVMRRAKSAKRKKNKNTSKSSINIEEELTRPDMSKYEDVREVLQHYLVSIDMIYKRAKTP